MGKVCPFNLLEILLYFTLQATHTLLALKDLLLVPSITKNLVSVSKFSKDNKVFFEFHSTYCVVKLQGTSEVLLRGSVGEDGLCSFDSIHSSTIGLSSSKNSSVSVVSVSPPTLKAF